MKLASTVAAFAVALFLVLSPVVADQTKAQQNIVETAIAAGSFNTLVAAVKAADLAEVLSGKGPFTVFAPTDEAFAKVPKEMLAALMKDKQALRRVLTYHVVPGKAPAAKVAGQRWIPTVLGQSLKVETAGDRVSIDGARVIAADIGATNGVIHVIDSVVLPRKDIVDTAVEAGSFKTLVTAVKAAGLVETLKGKGPFTVFAPSDEAFARLPEGTVPALLKDVSKLKGILTYHVVSGRILAGDIATGTTEIETAQGGKLRIVRAKDGAVTVNGARVVSTDIVTGNGVIHVIDGVVLPPK